MISFIWYLCNKHSLFSRIFILCTLRHHIVEEIASAVADTDLSYSNLSPQTFDTTTSTAPSTALEPSSPTEKTEAEGIRDVSKRRSPQEVKRYIMYNARIRNNRWLIGEFCTSVLIYYSHGLFLSIYRPFKAIL